MVLPQGRHRLPRPVSQTAKGTAPSCLGPARTAFTQAIGCPGLPNDPWNPSPGRMRSAPVGIAAGRLKLLFPSLSLCRCIVSVLAQANNYRPRGAVRPKGRLAPGYFAALLRCTPGRCGSTSCGAGPPLATCRGTPSHPGRRAVKARQPGERNQKWGFGRKGNADGGADLRQSAPIRSCKLAHRKPVPARGSPTRRRKDGSSFCRDSLPVLWDLCPYLSQSFRIGLRRTLSTMR